MASHMYTFADLYKRVSRFLGTYGTSGPSGDDLITAKEYTNSGYFTFLGINSWTFLRANTSLSTASGQWEYELPEDFREFVGGINYSQTDYYPPLEERSLDYILAARSEGQISSYPQYYAQRMGKYTKETGQRKELVLWPEPNGVWKLYYTYRMNVPRLTGDDDCHIGGADMTEAVLAFALAAAELEADGQPGAWAQKAAEAAGAAIMLDKGRNPRRLGMLSDDGTIRTYGAERGPFRVNNVTYTE